MCLYNILYNFIFNRLILKTTYELSDEDVVERTLYDMAFKYFLNLAPEEVDLYL
ncbi:transposase [Clostridium sp. WILCCON 0269]|uniref:Transposase n=1 Tax=Candidatus Clostridium eludens TaxID=3381663 RepID=A0ABW8SSR0_9CLOT